MNRGLSILVVEDDIDSQNFIEYFLRDKYDTSFTSSVMEAKKYLEERHFDLILLDLSLEGDEDGLDFVRFLRRTKKWQKLPVIAVTAHAFVTDRENCFEAGCNEYLTKPVRSKYLLESIEKILLNTINNTV